LQGLTKPHGPLKKPSGVAGKNRSSSNPIDMIEDMRDAIRGTEYHVGAIRALLNEISGDPAARGAIKPYLKKK
jgi:hypothetical protein